MNRVMTTLAFLIVIALIACVTGFIAIVFVDRYHRAHPITPVLPNAYQDIKGSPLKEQLAPRVYEHDVKG